MADVSCDKCGGTEDLETHHISYIPDVTETLCKFCHANKKRRLYGGLIPILKIYPQQGKIQFPTYFLKQLGELARFYPAPISPVGVLFPHKMQLREVEQVLEIILQDIRLRMGKVGEELKVE